MTAVRGITKEAGKTRRQRHSKQHATSGHYYTKTPQTPFFFVQKIRGKWELPVGGGGPLECGQILQKVSTSWRFLVLVLGASVTCHLLPNVTMSIYMGGAGFLLSWCTGPYASGPHTRPVLGDPSAAPCGWMNAIYSAPNHLHERAPQESIP
jgi:hypothetical protein